MPPVLPDLPTSLVVLALGGSVLLVGVVVTSLIGAVRRPRERDPLLAPRDPREGSDGAAVRGGTLRVRRSAAGLPRGSGPVASAHAGFKDA